MNQKDTAVIIDGKEIDFKNYLTTLQQNPNPIINKKGLFIEVENYEEFGVIIRELIGVCATALLFIDENAEIESNTMYREFGANTGSVATVLKYVTQLIPFAELELLNKLSDSTNEAK